MQMDGYIIPKNSSCCWLSAYLIATKAHNMHVINHPGATRFCDILSTIMQVQKLFIKHYWYLYHLGWKCVFVISIALAEGLAWFSARTSTHCVAINIRAPFQYKYTYLTRIRVSIIKIGQGHCVQGPDSIWRCHLISIGNPIVEIRRS